MNVIKPGFQPTHATSRTQRTQRKALVRIRQFYAEHCVKFYARHYAQASRALRCMRYVACVGYKSALTAV